MFTSNNHAFKILIKNNNVKYIKILYSLDQNHEIIFNDELLNIALGYFHHDFEINSKLVEWIVLKKHDIGFELENSDEIKS